MDRKINILLLGGAGFIGSNIVRYFIDNDSYTLFVLESEESDLYRINDFLDKVTVQRCCLMDVDRIKSIIVDNSIDIIIHLIGRITPGSKYEEYLAELNGIIYPTIQIIEFCSDLKIKFVYFSSGGAIYGNSSKKKYSEDAKIAPISYYGLAKSHIEEIILFYNRTKGLKYLIIRPSNPYGQGQNIFGNQGLIAVIIGKIIRKETICIWGDGSAIRDYIYIMDLVEIFYKNIELNIHSEILNIGSGIGYSVNEIIDVIKRNVSHDIDVEYVDKRLCDVSSIVLDITKQKKIIDHSFTPIEKGIKEFYETIKYDHG